MEEDNYQKINLSEKKKGQKGQKIAAFILFQYLSATSIQNINQKKAINLCLVKRKCEN